MLNPVTSPFAPMTLGTVSGSTRFRVGLVTLIIAEPTQNLAELLEQFPEEAQPSISESPQIGGDVDMGGDVGFRRAAKN